MNKIVIPALLVALAGAFVVGADQMGIASVGSASNEDELRYPADPEAQRMEFQETGFVTVLVPVLGELVLTGESNPLMGEGNRSAPYEYLHLLGEAVDYPGSTANILVGEYGTYGSITIPGPDGEVEYAIDAVETDERGVYDQWVHVREGSASPHSLKG